MPHKIEIFMVKYSIIQIENDQSQKTGKKYGWFRWYEDSPISSIQWSMSQYENISILEDKFMKDVRMFSIA